MNITMLILGLGLIRPLSAGVLKAEEAGALVTYQEPLYFSYNLKGPLILESEIIPAAGTITAISAFWDFEGQARLEVSATAGSSYIGIVNGQVLNAGFLPGSALRFRINIADDSRLKSVVIGYKDTSGVCRLFRNQELPGFKYHRELEISAGDKELFNYPLKIELRPGTMAIGQSTGEISQSSLRANKVSPALPAGREAIPVEIASEDFSDVRFAASDGSTPLNYYLESIDVKNRSACFWVKLPQVPREGLKIHLYSGNKDAESLSDGNKVFAFFEDFNQKNPDEKKWQSACGFNKRIILKEGYLKLEGCSLVSADFKMQSGVLEFKAKADENAAIQAIVHGEPADKSGYPAEEMVYSSAYPGAEHTIAVNDVAKLNAGSPIVPGQEYIYQAGVSPTGIIFARYRLDYQKEAEIRFLDTYNQNRGYIGFKSNNLPLSGAGSYFDWVRVRPYAEVEPKVTAVSCQPSAVS